MTSVSPSLKSRIENQQSNVQMSKNSQQIAADLSQKADTVEISKNTKQNKTAKYIGIGVALAGAFAVSVFLLTKGKTCLLEFNAKKAQKYAEDIQEKAEKLKSEVIELFNAGGIKNGNEVANITDNVDCKIMEEIDSSGALIRKSIFGLDGDLREIELPAKKGVDKYCFKNGKLTRYLKNHQYDSEGNSSTEKLLFFENGKLIEYYKNKQVVSKKYSSAAKILFFEDDKLIEYCKNSQIGPKSESTAKDLFFEDGKLTRYLKNHQYDSEGNSSIEKEIKFTPGKPLKNLLEFLKSFKKF